ncbi:MAG: T9SS type A sorting domain-containing protein [Bacteroidia bacterium]|nr:T9SS type A sorting domain-containing protein [Bacteroidia bacterium]
MSGTNLSTIDWDIDIPSSVQALTEIETPTNVADNYGGRIRGYIFPPQTGTYNFWIASDDQGELFISIDDDPANKVSIANVPGWTSSRQWAKYPDDQQGSVSLVAGQRYYFEARFKEGGGGDNLAVRWQLPDGTFEEPIGAGRIASFNGGAYPLLWREEFHLPDNLLTDDGGTKWDANSSNLGGNATYGTSGQALLGTNLDGEAIWTSDSVYIGSESSVTVSFDYRGDGVFENPDYFRVYYKLDGGAEQLLLDMTGSAIPAATTTFTSGPISGSRIELVVRTINSTLDETYFLDNVTISSNGSASSLGAAECASCVSSIADRVALRGQYGSCVSEFNNAFLEIQDQYEEVLLSINDNNQDLGLVTVETFDHGNDPFVYGDFYYLTRSFEISTQKTFASPVRIKLYVLPSEFDALKESNPTVSSLSDLVLEKYSNGKLGEVGNGSLTTVLPVSTSLGTGPDGAHELVYDVSSFSTFFLRASQTTFPVEWLDFKASVEGLDGLLKWEVAQDGKGSHFEVERSTDGTEYKKIATLVMEEPTGHSNSYAYTDKNIADLGVQTLYYRIRQFDFNGQETLGPIRILSLDLSKQLRVNIYPNPATDGFTLRYFLPENTAAQYEIFDALGKVVAKGLLEKQEGISKVMISTTDWSKGVYFIKVRHSLGSITEKILIE